MPLTALVLYIWVTIGASYYARKKEITQKMGLGVSLRSSDHSARDKIEDTLLIGPYLAERRFKKGKFDNNFLDIDEKILINYKQSLQF